MTVRHLKSYYFVVELYSETLAKVLTPDFHRLDRLMFTSKRLFLNQSSYRPAACFLFVPLTFTAFRHNVFEMC